MTDLCKLFLSMSLSGAILTVLLLLARPIYSKRISWKCRYYIWIVVLLRFLIPVSFGFSLMNHMIPKNIPHIFTSVVMDQEKVFRQRNTVPEPSAEHLMADEESYPKNSQSKISSEGLIALLWLFVFIVLLLWKVINYKTYIYFLRKNAEYVLNPTLLDILSEVQEELKIRGKIELMQFNKAASPMLIGLFRPTVILPDKDWNENDLYKIFHHELIHYKRQDLIYKWLVQITVCLHWFNPMVYIMAKEINKNCELSCDEALMKKMTEDEVIAYGNMLLKSAAYTETYRAVAHLTLSENGKQLKERLRAIKNYKRGKYNGVLSAIFTILVFTIALSLGTYAYANENNLNKEVKIEREENIEEGEKIEKEESTQIFHNYMMRTFYEDGYVLSLGSAEKPDDISKYSEIMKEIILSDGSVISLFFLPEASDYANDKVVVQNITKAVEKFVKQREESEMPTNYYSVHSVEGPFTGTPKELAEQFYKTNQLAGFDGVLGELSDREIKEYADKAYKNQDYSIFAICCDYMKESDVSLFAEKFYKVDEIGFFAVLVDAMSQEEINQWIRRAREDGKVGFESMLQG